MSNKPVLVVMAAGMGSRYGGLKQMDPMGLNGEFIMDFSVYDAIRAGFTKVIFIIKREMEETFKEVVGNRLEGHIEVEYVFQELHNIPAGFNVPDGRIKPWGTGHAVLSAKDSINGPFAVINADDFYGQTALKEMYNFLVATKTDDKYHFCMVGYNVENTLSESGYVSRGVCETNAQDYLTDITERTHIEKQEDKIVYIEGGIATELQAGTPVSMNLWGFSREMMDELDKRFITFLEKTIKENPEKGEYFLPFVVNDLLHEEKATAKVLLTPDKWYGVTNKEDKEGVSAAIQEMQNSGTYPQKLWK